jgi:hypothetical protein
MWKNTSPSVVALRTKPKPRSASQRTMVPCLFMRLDRIDARCRAVLPVVAAGGGNCGGYQWRVGWRGGSASRSSK